jgi:hypothetical protein
MNQNASKLGLSNISEVYDGDNGLALSVYRTADASRYERLIHSLATVNIGSSCPYPTHVSPSTLRLASIDLVYDMKSATGVDACALAMNQKHLSRSLSFVNNKFITFQLVRCTTFGFEPFLLSSESCCRRYPAIFGPWCRVSRCSHLMTT